MRLDQVLHLDLLFKEFSDDQLAMFIVGSFLDSYETYVSMNQNHLFSMVEQYKCTIFV